MLLVASRVGAPACTISWCTAERSKDGWWYSELWWTFLDSRVRLLVGRWNSKSEIKTTGCPVKHNDFPILHVFVATLTKCRHAQKYNGEYGGNAKRKSQ